MVRRFLLAACLVCPMVLTTPGQAESGGDAIVFIRKVGAEVPGILASARTIEERRVKLLPFVERVVDVGAFARFCMGRYWGQATPTQQQQIQALFVSVVVNTIAIFTGERRGFGPNTSVTIQPPVVHGDETAVPTIVQASSVPTVHVTWVVNMTEQPPRILDVSAEGISARTTVRSDFVSFLDHHGGDIDGLIKVLRQRAHDTGGVLAGTDEPFSKGQLR
jgi:phospholipid transport system substrate-binding protein